MKVLIVDCYDSFTFNLYQQVGKLGGNPVVMTCDTPLERLEKSGCERIILSPGRGLLMIRGSVRKYWTP